MAHPPLPLFQQESDREDVQSNFVVLNTQVLKEMLNEESGTEKPWVRYLPSIDVKTNFPLLLISDEDTFIHHGKKPVRHASNTFSPFGEKGRREEKRRKKVQMTVGAVNSRTTFPGSTRVTVKEVEVLLNLFSINKREK